MNDKPNLHLLVKSTTAVLCLFCVSVASANTYSYDPRQPGLRAGRMTIYPLYQYWESSTNIDRELSFDDLPGVVADINFDLDSAQALGFGFGYELSNRITINGEFAFASPEWKMSFNNAELTGEAFMHTGQVNFDYNFFRGRFTPFVSAGGGYLSFDTGIPTGESGVYCWWDYYWGYVCSGYTPTYTNTLWATNLGGGLRWDPSDAIFMKFSANIQYFDTHSNAGWHDFTRYSFIFGWKF